MPTSSPPPPAYTVFVIPERSGRLRRFRLTHRQLMRMGRAGLAVVGLVAVLGGHAWRLSRLAQVAQADRSARLDLRARLMRLADEAERLEVAQARLLPRTARLAALAAAHGGGGAPPVGGLGEVLYAANERIDDEDEALDSQLGRRLADDVSATGGAADPPLASASGGAAGLGGHPLGLQLRAPAEGVVADVAHSPGDGWAVDIDHGAGLASHCAPLAHAEVRAGQRVRQGQRLGTAAAPAVGAAATCRVAFGRLPAAQPASWPETP